ncbi:MAG: bifunctional folylpolyglutamate synthase/dihydrofolate synthase, partial [Pseudomonadota bacterium]
MRRACAALGDPQTRLNRPIHIAGTNGKGSTLAMMQACAAAAGQRVCAYHSPAETLADQILRPDGSPMNGQATAALTRVAAAAPDLSVFERETLAAFLLMADTPHDLALVEVGMGGDDDATNVLPDCAAAAITPVALDHQAFLGTDVAMIAQRKAGIAKPGRPLVLAAQDPAAEAAIVDVATDLGAGPILRRGGDWTVETVGDGLRVTLGAQSIAAPGPALRGPHQIDNAGLALATLMAAGVAFDPAALASAFFPKRMQAVDPADFGFPAHWRAFRDG